MTTQADFDEFLSIVKDPLTKIQWVESMNLRTSRKMTNSVVMRPGMWYECELSKDTLHRQYIFVKADSYRLINVPLYGPEFWEFECEHDRLWAVRRMPGGSIETTYLFGNPDLLDEPPELGDDYKARIERHMIEDADIGLD